MNKQRILLTMNVIFLDFDGVVNIPSWYKTEGGKFKCCYNFPRHGCVNSFQACQWVSEFCEKHNYKIVISSTWRSDGLKKCIQYLRNGGLRSSIEVIDITPKFEFMPRGDEITAWLEKHSDVKNYLIFDDDSDMTQHMDRLVQCDGVVGFTMNEFNQAEILYRKFKK
jgi:hypothetical protein